MSVHQSLLVELESRIDQYQQTFYMGRFRAPVTLNFKGGVAFLIYTSVPDEEEMRIAMPKANADCGPVKRRMKATGNGSTEVDKYIIRLEQRTDQDGRIFYIGVVQDDQLELDMAKEGLVFFVFTAKPGKKELHIGRNDFSDRREASNQDVSVEHRRSSSQFKASGDSGDYQQPFRRAVG